VDPDALDKDFASTFKGNLVVQKYSDAGGWTDFTAPSLTYDTSTMEIKFTWSSVQSREIYRVVARNSQQFTTEEAIAGSPRKFPAVHG
jgi:hypothetical protein